MLYIHMYIVVILSGNNNLNNNDIKRKIQRPSAGSSKSTRSIVSEGEGKREREREGERR